MAFERKVRLQTRPVIRSLIQVTVNRSGRAENFVRTQNCQLVGDPLLDWQPMQLVQFKSIGFVRRSRVWRLTPSQRMNRVNFEQLEGFLPRRKQRYKFHPRTSHGMQLSINYELFRTMKPFVGHTNQYHCQVI